MPTVIFTRDKFTAGTGKYVEDGPRDKHVIGTLYIRKTSGLTDNAKLVVTVEPGK